MSVLVRTAGSRLGARVAVAVGVAVALGLAVGLVAPAGGRAPSASDAAAYREKLAIMQREEALRRAQSGAVRSGRIHPVPFQPAQAAGSAPPEGIMEADPPFPSSLYALQNKWQQLIGSHLVQVYAGAAASDPAHGLLVVASLPWNLQTMELDFAHQAYVVTEYAAPSGMGPLTVVGADGLRLTVASGDGRRATFDLLARQFGP